MVTPIAMIATAHLTISMDINLAQREQRNTIHLLHFSPGLDPKILMDASRLVSLLSPFIWHKHGSIYIGLQAVLMSYARYLTHAKRKQKRNTIEIPKRKNSLLLGSVRIERHCEVHPSNRRIGSSMVVDSDRENRSISIHWHLQLKLQQAPDSDSFALQPQDPARDPGSCASESVTKPHLAPTTPHTSRSLTASKPHLVQHEAPPAHRQGHRRRLRPFLLLHALHRQMLQLVLLS